MTTRIDLITSASRSKHVDVSLVTGTLNEVGNVQSFLEAVRRELEKVGSFEIIIVDDGSTDGTIECLKQIASSDARVIVIANNRRRGLLRSHLQAMALANGQYCIVMDSDLQHPAHIIPQIVEDLRRGYGIVICSRYITGGSPGDRNAVRGVISRMAIVIAKLILPSARCTTDPVSGYFGVERTNFIASSGSEKGYKTLLLVLANHYSGYIKDMPYNFAKRSKGESKIVSDWRFAINYFFEVIQARKSYSETRRMAHSPLPVPDQTDSGADKISEG